jgi:hypothetical protein
LPSVGHISVFCVVSVPHAPQNETNRASVVIERPSPNRVNPTLAISPGTLVPMPTSVLSAGGCSSLAA